MRGLSVQEIESLIEQKTLFLSQLSGQCRFYYPIRNLIQSFNKRYLLV